MWLNRSLLPWAIIVTQQPERMRRIGILLPAAAGDAEFQVRVGAFLDGLQQLGWIDGRNAQIDSR